MVDGGSAFGTPVFAGLAEVTEALNSGGGGLPGLQRSVEVAGLVTGAAGAAFIEYAADNGRVIAAAGELAWALGRPVDLIHPAVRGLLQFGTRVREFPSSLIGTAGGLQLASRGLYRVMASEAAANGTGVGVLFAAYGDSEEPTGEREKAALGFLASFIGLQYGLGRGLPVYSDGPAVKPAGEPFALLDTEHRVRAWNPPAALLTSVPAETAIGEQFPFPLPAGDATIAHKLPSGRWMEIRTARVTGSQDLAVSFRARPEPPPDGRDLFIALTGHELRTPVTVIRGYADTLVDHWESLSEESRREAIQVVGQRARELSRLVDRLLNAVGDDGAPAVESTTLLPFDLVESLAGAVEDLNAEQRQSLTVRLPDSLPKTRGDRASLATVLAELVTNAGKYSPKWVEIELTAGADARTVWFRVSDRGIGIRPEHVERAFDRFWQLETGDQRSSGGVGLGLYLVRRIVERQHGWVSLRPRQGGGTVAEVRLPRADADGPGEA
ncbi:HAMP domain-containing histidine kinase [Dactylosporangium vinaceum]|uniref:histidine kinase n=1 Tax=Dactylosporangium vinaceum TaxID=53362 RepID=A0ABV5MQ45_9ACTN|nr:HAMP domain-containing sensor histidine kinase [Dactylosporangium vinaceum]UAB96568.1 HAMP domain-containing histidine kinase [Dactylosporangium vinaceum]